MSRLIFITLMSLFIGSITLGLTGCASDEGYDRSGGGFTDPFKQAHGGSRFQADDVLAGGFGN